MGPAVAVSSFSATDVTIDGGTPPPPPPAKTGDLYVGLSAASLQQVCGEQACNLTVNVIDPTSTILESINFNPKINPNQIIAYTHLATGNYTVSAVNNSLPAGTIVYYTPNNGIVSVNSDESSQVEVFFNYEKPAKLASTYLM